MAVAKQLAIKSPQRLQQFQSFIQVARTLRWLLIAMVVISFPLHVPQTSTAYLLAAILGVYNLASYLPGPLAGVLFRTRFSIVLIDNLFIAILLAAIGGVDTPYWALLIFTVVGAAYLYRLAGAVIVVLAQSAILLVASHRLIAQAVVVDDVRRVIIFVIVLLALGAWIDRFSSSDRKERLLLLRSHQAIDRQQKRLRALVNSLSYAVFVTNSKGVILENNEAARVLADCDEPLIGRKFTEIIELRPRSNPQADPVDVLKHNTSAQHRRDLQVLLKDGNNIDLDISVTPVEAESGNATEYIFVCEDITKERSLDEQRSEFISVTSHELRTPLAILEGSLETVLAPSSTLPSKTKALIEQAYRNTRLLAGIVKDITILSEAKNDNLPIQLSQVDPTKTLNELAKDFETQAQQKGITIIDHVEPSTPQVLSTERYVHEILQNFITNALKYSEKGTITLAAQPAKNGGVLFSVADEGIGISPKNQKLLFTKFFRVEDYRTRSTGGSGLGLYLCMEIAQRMGARLWCTSRLDHGSTFFLEVPRYSKLQRDQGEVIKAQVASLIDDL